MELVAVELVRGWLIIHALSPVQKKFWQEINRLGKGVDDGQDVYGR